MWSKLNDAKSQLFTLPISLRHLAFWPWLVAKTIFRWGLLKNGFLYHKWQPISSQHPATLGFSGNTYPRKARVRKLFSRGHPNMHRGAGLPTTCKGAHTPCCHSGACSNQTWLHMCCKWSISFCCHRAQLGLENPLPRSLTCLLLLGVNISLPIGWRVQFLSAECSP